MMWAFHAKRDPDYRSDEEKAALAVMSEGYYQLKALGWREAIYCPKDGTMFLAVEAGCTAVFPCNYKGDWPKGSWWAYHSGDVWPCHPSLFKPMPKEKGESSE